MAKATRSVSERDVRSGGTNPGIEGNSLAKAGMKAAGQGRQDRKGGDGGEKRSIIRGGVGGNVCSLGSRSDAGDLTEERQTKTGAMRWVKKTVQSRLMVSDRP